MHTNVYKGGGGCELDKSTHFVSMFIENGTLSQSFKVRLHVLGLIW